MPDFMTPDGVADAIRTVLLTVPGMGLVYTERKVIKNEDDANRWLYVPAEDRVNAWFITLAPTGTSFTKRNPGHAEIGRPTSNANDLTGLNFVIEGYYSIQNDRSSEKLFRNLAFAAMTTINSYGIIAPNLGISFQSGADLSQVLYANFAGMYSLHYTSITVGFTGRCY